MFRGVAAKHIPSLIGEIRQRHSVGLSALVETKIGGNKAEKIS